MNRYRPVGAVLLIVGGLVEAAALTGGSTISVPWSTPLGACLVVAYAVGWICTGVGLLLTGVSLAARGRAALMVAGALAVIAPVLSAVQTVTAAPLGPGPAAATEVLFVVAVLVAALRLRSDAGLRQAVRWSMAVPAACFAIAVVAVFVPPVALPGVTVLPWVGTAAAGVLLLRVRQRPDARRDGEVGKPRLLD